MRSAFSQSISYPSGATKSVAISLLSSLSSYTGTTTCTGSPMFSPFSSTYCTYITCFTGFTSSGFSSTTFSHAMFAEYSLSQLHSIVQLAFSANTYPSGMLNISSVSTFTSSVLTSIEPLSRSSPVTES